MYGERKMCAIKCSECGREDAVPFQPQGDRPVYNRDRVRPEGRRP